MIEFIAYIVSSRTLNLRVNVLLERMHHIRIRDKIHTHTHKQTHEIQVLLLFNE